MSVQWAITAGFLYVEIFVVILLLLPIISPKRWKQLFNSALIKRVQKKANQFFLFLTGTLSILLLDSIREIFKYNDVTPLGEAYNINLQQSREFRAQRNLYITGIALFLSFVIKRLVILLTRTADLIEDVEFLTNQTSNLAKQAYAVSIRKEKFAANEENKLPSAPPSVPKESDQPRSRSKSKKEL